MCQGEGPRWSRSALEFCSPCCLLRHCPLAAEIAKEHERCFSKADVSSRSAARALRSRIEFLRRMDRLKSSHAVLAGPCFVHAVWIAARTVKTPGCTWTAGCSYSFNPTCALLSSVDTLRTPPLSSPPQCRDVQLSGTWQATGAELLNAVCRRRRAVSHTRPAVSPTNQIPGS